ncbi:MAG TPA: siroheme synthase [Dongiaceae bacterium]|nr:siroheme synthase [Dongiaceae bacterium]
MTLFPLFLDVTGRKIVIAGGTEAAFAKARLVLEASAMLEVTSPDLIPEFAAWIEGRARWNRRAFTSQDLQACALVIAAGNEEEDGRIAALARAAAIPCNVVDRPEMGTVVMPAVITRGDVVIAVSTQGASPVLAQRIRAAIEEALPPRLDRLANFARRFRGAVRTRIDDSKRRRLFWDRIFSGPIAEDIMAGNEGRASRSLIRALNGAPLPEPVATLTTIAARCADDLTLREMRALRQADRLFVEGAVDPDILRLARRDAVLHAGSPSGESGNIVWLRRAEMSQAVWR